MPFLVRLACEVPPVAYFKIEIPETDAKLRALIEVGATGTMPSALRWGK